MAARRSQKLTVWWKDRVVPTAGAVTLLAGVATLAWQFSNANDEARLESQQRGDALNLDKTRKAYEDEIAQMKSQFELLPRQAGEQRLFDLNTLAITPDQARQLPESYFPYELDDMRLYLSLPKASDWSYMRTTEEDFAPLLYEQRVDYKQPRSWSGEERYLHDLAKKQEILLWKYNNSPTTFDVATTESSIATIHIFPYVSVEIIKNNVATEVIFPAFSRIEEKLTSYLDETFTKLDGEIAALNSMNSTLSEISKRLSYLPAFTLPNLANIRHPSRDEIQAGMKEIILTFVGDLTKDSAAFWATFEISTNLRRVAKIPGASFQVLQAEKNGPLFHLIERFKFPGSQSQPERYWDQEVIFMGTADATLLITMSDPWTLPQRPVNSKWTATWLSGLKIAFVK